jgi:serpin B
LLCGKETPYSEGTANGKDLAMKTLFVWCGVCSLAVAAFGAAANSNEKTVVTGNTEFACDLYGKLRSQPGNLFLSPYSISTALAMTSGGARGNTKAQMAKAMRFDLPPAELHPAFAALQDGLNAVQKKGQVKLAIANSLWPQKGYQFLPAYLDLCKEQYGTVITPLDYAKAAEPARRTINRWVEDKTNKKIPDLIAPGVLGALTRLVLVNAIYFKGTWRTKFAPTFTHEAPFHISASKSVQASLMVVTTTFWYSETPDLQTLELPYADGAISMVVFLPRQPDGLAGLENRLTTSGLTAPVEHLTSQRVRVFLPKFKTTSRFSLADTLQQLGIVDAFQSGKADFSGMANTRELYLSALLHQAFVEVTEDGTEAAAASGAIAVGCSAHVEEPSVLFRADHPFLFLIRDNRTGSLLFLGRIADPTRQ